MPRSNEDDLKWMCRGGFAAGLAVASFVPHQYLLVSAACVLVFAVVALFVSALKERR